MPLIKDWFHSGSFQEHNKKSYGALTRPCWRYQYLIMNSFLIFGLDNGKYAFDQKSRITCPDCGLVNRDKSQRNTFNKLKYDISCTYDGELLISHSMFEVFTMFVDENNFVSAGNYYYVIPKLRVEIDSNKRKIKFGDNCFNCGSPSSVIGLTPAFLKSEIMNSGLYSSDLHYGDVADDGSNLTPCIIVTEDILRAVLALEPMGLDSEQTNC